MTLATSISPHASGVGQRGIGLVFGPSAIPYLMGVDSGSGGNSAE